MKTGVTAKTAKEVLVVAAAMASLLWLSGTVLELDWLLAPAKALVDALRGA